MGAQGAYHELPDGTRLPRVTSILDAISKSRLVNWSARIERELVVRVASQMNAALPGGVTALALNANLGAHAHALELAEANAIGSEVHARIEWRMQKELGVVVGPKPPLSAPALIAYNAFDRWRKSVKLRPIFIEQRVWSREYGFAGTMDLFCEITLPDIGTILVVLDWKTSKRIYGESGLQNAAYVHGLIEMGHAKPPVHGLILRMPKVNAPNGAILECETKFYHHETQGTRFGVFLAALEIFHWQEEQEKLFKPPVLPTPERPAVPAGPAFEFG